MGVALVAKQQSNKICSYNPQREHHSLLWPTHSTVRNVINLQAKLQSIRKRTTKAVTHRASGD